MHPELQFLVRLMVAAVLSAILGWERESARKAAGLRTHILVGVAAALYTSIAELAVSDISPNEEGFQADPIRAVQAVAIGVGFLGGGTIFVARERNQVHGLTTAASIWATAAIGVAVALGNYILAGGATLLLLFVLRGLVRFDSSD
jgi:putative Mg2+ transporter-C (MgtC) family protein